MVITGDNKSIVEAICREVGVFYEGEDLSDTTVTRREFMVLSVDKHVEIFPKPNG